VHVEQSMRRSQQGQAAQGDSPSMSTPTLLPGDHVSGHVCDLTCEQTTPCSAQGFGKTGWQRPSDSVGWNDESVVTALQALAAKHGLQVQPTAQVEEAPEIGGLFEDFGYSCTISGAEDS